ncbi:MAG: class I tRNA ligase family protein, partial [bacterium]
LNRIWRMVHSLVESARSGEGKIPLPTDGSIGEIADSELQFAVHHAIKEVTLDIEERKSLNTAIARLMELSNTLASCIGRSAPHSDILPAVGILLRLLAPFAPHIAEECWETLGANRSILKTPWPDHDDKFLVKSTMTIAIQVSGKLRDTIEVPTDISEEDLIKACHTEKVENHIGGKAIRKTIVVPKKLVNFVV